MFGLLANSLSVTFRSYYELLCKSGAPLFALFLGNLAISMAIDISLEKSFSEDSLIFIEVLGLLLTSGFDALFFLFLLLACHQMSSGANISLNKSIQRLVHGLSQVIIEFLRSIASVIRWSLLFLLPGLFKQVAYTFVPLVVLFDQDYEKGEIDALKKSEFLCKKIILVLASYLLFDALVTSFLDASLSIDQIKSSPFLFATSATTLFLFKAFMISLLFQLYSQQSRQCR